MRESTYLSEKQVHGNMGFLFGGRENGTFNLHFKAIPSFKDNLVLLQSPKILAPVSFPWYFAYQNNKYLTLDLDPFELL